MRLFRFLEKPVLPVPDSVHSFRFRKARAKKKLNKNKEKKDRMVRYCGAQKDFPAPQSGAGALLFGGRAR